MTTPPSEPPTSPPRKPANQIPARPMPSPTQYGAHRLEHPTHAFGLPSNPYAKNGRRWHQRTSFQIVGAVAAAMLALLVLVSLLPPSNIELELTSATTQTPHPTTPPADPLLDPFNVDKPNEQDLVATEDLIKIEMEAGLFLITQHTPDILEEFGVDRDLGLTVYAEQAAALCGVLNLSATTKDEFHNALDSTWNAIASTYHRSYWKSEDQYKRFGKVAVLWKCLQHGKHLQ